MCIILVRYDFQGKLSTDYLQSGVILKGMLTVNCLQSGMILKGNL